MTSPRNLAFDRPPLLGPALPRATLQRKPGLSPGEALPRFAAELAPQVIDETQLAAYRAVCGLSADVPVTWPQVLATRLHVSLLTQGAFPLRAMGLVHPRCTMMLHRPLAAGDRLGVECWLEGLRELESGHGGGQGPAIG